MSHPPEVAMLSEPVEAAFDDLAVLLNPVQTATLETVLALTPWHRRIDVALAFAGLSAQQWAYQAGFPATYIHRWRNAERIPLGAALRLCRILGGVDPALLFEQHIW